MDETNIDNVIDDFNLRADGIYRINKKAFIQSKVMNAEIFYDFPIKSFEFKSHQIISALAYSNLKHKERMLFGGETIIFRRNGFNLKIYDKKKECFKKKLGVRFKELNLNIQNTLRVEVGGRDDARSTGLDEYYFKNKRLEELLSLHYQYSLILDYVNGLSLPVS